jgi:hypothetical protein
MVDGNRRRKRRRRRRKKGSHHHLLWTHIPHSRVGMQTCLAL